jgi:primosomal protein N' (replication factor Y)
MDTDATRKRGSHERILGDFKKHHIDILVGTQMIAKGLDFPKVTLVGVVNADVTLNLPDFRASERTFNLLTQVAGRAGRGEEGGEVVIQTYAPSHYAILTASKHDYEKFYQEEIGTRKELSFPPFVHLIRLTLRSRNEKKALDASARVRGFYRWNILLKGKNRSTMTQALGKALRDFRCPSATLLAVDVDPVSM